MVSSLALNSNILLIEIFRNFTKYVTENKIKKNERTEKNTQPSERETQEPASLLNPKNQRGSKVACGRTHGNLMPAL